MMLNKEQAAAAWCPMVRIAVDHTAGGPATVNDPTSAYFGSCIVESCAMWRWAGPAPERHVRAEWWPKNDDHPLTEPPRPKEVPASAEWVPLTGSDTDWEGGYWLESLEAVEARNATAEAQRRGYCGLAGRPAEGGAA